ncbi:MAG: hypothetical protein Q9191_004583 [Dirinaria sp. TL-2023a]
MTSTTSFDEKTEADEVVTAFSDSIKGKTILITGVSPNGLGEAFAKSVARHEPALLILTGRTVQKVEAVVAQFSVQVPTRMVKLDVASFTSIRTGVKEIKSFAQHIDILVNNAGVMNVPERRLSEDGFEMHLAVNHLGPFLLTTGLMPLLTASQGSRIVNVGSNGYAFSPFRFADYNFDGNPIPEAEQPSKELCKQYGLPWTLEYTPTIAYGQSKTAIMLFTVQLAKLYNNNGITAICIHPGGTAFACKSETIVIDQLSSDRYRTLETHGQRDYAADFCHATNEILKSGKAEPPPHRSAQALNGEYGIDGLEGQHVLGRRYVGAMNKLMKASLLSRYELQLSEVNVARLPITSPSPPPKGDGIQRHHPRVGTTLQNPSLKDDPGCPGAGV